MAEPYRKTDPRPRAKQERALSLDEMIGSPGYLIRRAHQFSTAAFATATAGHDLTAVQFAAMVVILNRPGTDAACVSELICFDRTTVGQVLGRLEGKGYIVREKVRTDGRRKSLRLTKAGEVVVRQVSALIPHVEHAILGRLNAEERALLGRLLQKLADPAIAGRLTDAA